MKAIIGERVGNTNKLSKKASPIQLLPKQLETMEAVTKYDFTVYSGAVAAGKTLLLSHIAIKTCINNPHCKGIIGSLTYTQLSNVVFTVFKEELAKYQQLLNKNGIPIKLIKSMSESHGKMKVEFFNGSIIYFLAMDKEEKIRGYTIDFFCLDEPIEIDERIFDQLIARLRGNKLQHRFGLLTTNPGAETHWIYQKFYKGEKESYHHIDTNSYENIFLPDGYIENMEESYDDDWKRRFLDGRWGAFEGQIYKSFNPNKHVLDKEKLANVEDDIKYYIAGVDWGITNPSCILTLGITKEKKVIVVDEYYQAEKTTAQVSKQLKKLDSYYNYKKIFIDPSAKDLITQCDQLHLPAEKGDNHVEPGIGKVKSLFSRGQIYISYKCRNLIRELQAYRYQRNKTNQNKNEKPLKKDDHAPDALRYGVYSFKLFKKKSKWTYVKSEMEDY